MPHLPLDLRIALRRMQRRPVVAIVSVIALAVGIGATTALFAIVDALLIRPLPYRDAGRLANVWITFPHWRGEPALDYQWDRIGLSWEDWDNVRANARSIEATGAAYFRTQHTSVGNVTEELVVAKGTASLLDVLGVRTALGRWFLPGETGAGAPQVAVASYEYWTTRLGGDASVLGREVRIAGSPHTLIGVLPPRFNFMPVGPHTEQDGPAALWLPVGTNPDDFTLNSHDYEALIRLRPDITVAAAEAELATLLRADRSHERRGGRVVPRLAAETGRARTPLLLLLGATSTILLIACGNVALLLLGEMRSRQAEMATRAALGAGRARLLRQLATESALLALVGGLSGIMLAVVAVRAVPALLPLTLPRASEITIDLRILTFALVISSITGLAAGLAPALSAARSAARLAGTRVTGRGTARATGIVMAAQIALSTVLLVSATLFGRSLLRQTAVQPGVDVDRLLAIPIQLPTWKHDITTRSVLQQRAHELLGALPGVEAATMTTRMPLSGEGGSWALALPPDTLLSSGSGVAYHEAVMPGFFTVLGIPILEGRDFTIGDGADAERVAIINSTMARRYWPGESPLGREFRAPNGGRRRVVGVAGDVRHHGLERPVEATFYEPLAQLGSGATVVLLRTRSQPLALAGAARTIIHQLDPDIPLPEIRTIEGVLSDSMADERFRAALTGSFGWVATLLAAVGLAGVTLRAVAARRRELGVRMALGATPAHAVRLVARGAVSAVAAGLAIGILLALGVARLLSSQLFGIGAADPVALAVAAAALIMVATLALAVPAAAAARTDPAEVLRVE